MPYSNIIYIKLFVELLDKDDRFLYQLNESQQLLYVKMLLLAGKTLNKIPKKFAFIRNAINYAHDESCFNADIKRITEVFPKMKESDEGYYFEKFDTLHNYVDSGKGSPKELRRKSKGTPIIEKGKHEGNPITEPDVEVDKEEEKEKTMPIIRNYFLSKYKEIRKTDYIINYQKDSVILKRLLKNISMDEMKLDINLKKLV